MTNNEIKILFFDDDEKDLKKYSSVLSEPNKIKVIEVLPPEHLNELDLSSQPDLVLIDYKLTQRQPSGISATYYGDTLSTYILENLPEIPILILSTRDVLKLFPKYEEEIQNADHVIYKTDVYQYPSYWKTFLTSLVQNFKKIANIEKHSRTWQILMKLLKANIIEVEELQRAAPPRFKSSSYWTIHSVARWILHVLFKYPGVLYDDLHASAALGINKEDFLLKEVQSFFRKALYTGLFSEIKKLWWRDQLQELAFKCIREEKLEPLLSRNFRIAFERKTTQKLKPSICVFSNEENANSICYILKKPVKMKYTLEYLPDNRPEVMETARISFKAILEEDIDESKLPLAEFERLNDIRKKYS